MKGRAEMGLFSKKVKGLPGVTLMVMKVSSPHDLQSIWETAYSDEEVVGELTSQGFGSDFTTKIDSSSHVQTKVQYEISGRLGANIEYYAELYQMLGFVSVRTTGDRQRLDEARRVLGKLEPLIASKLPEVKPLISAI
jgi:hypothetical protein